MPHQDPVPEQRAVHAICLLVYQLFLVLASAAQPYKIDEIQTQQLENSSHPTFVLKTGQYQDGKAFPLPPAGPKVHRAIIVNNRCNICWMVMKSLLVSLLHTVNPLIKVDVMTVLPKPYLLLKINDITPATVHTILRITTSEGQFVLDLTAEQYGWTGGAFFPLDVYTRRFCKYDKGYLFGVEHFTNGTEASMEKHFLAHSSNAFWHKAQAHLVDLEREFRSRFPEGVLRREYFTSKPEMRGLVTRLRELVYRG